MRRGIDAIVMLVLVGGCASVRTPAPATTTPSPAPAATATPASTPETPPPTAAPPAPSVQAPAASPPPAPPPATTASAATASPAPAVRAPKPAAPAPAAPARTASAPTPAPVAAPAPPPAAPAKPTAPSLDLTSLEQRLRDTRAIGVFTKLSLKNQVDALLDQFRARHKGAPIPTLAELRQRYDLLLLKVLTLLQDGDPTLAQAITSSRETIWGILNDPKEFAKI